MEYLSKQRYDEIAAELKHLINEVYPFRRFWSTHASSTRTTFQKTEFAF